MAAQPPRTACFIARRDRERGRTRWSRECFLLTRASRESDRALERSRARRGLETTRDVGESLSCPKNGTRRRDRASSASWPRFARACFSFFGELGNNSVETRERSRGLGAMGSLDAARVSWLFFKTLAIVLYRTSKTAPRDTVLEKKNRSLAMGVVGARRAPRPGLAAGVFKTPASFSQRSGGSCLGHLTMRALSLSLSLSLVLLKTRSDLCADFADLDPIFVNIGETSTDGRRERPLESCFVHK